MEVRKGRTARERLAAVIAADMTSTLAASEATGIPRSTLRHWMQDPELAIYRQKTREDLAAEMTTLAHMAAEALAGSIRSGKMEPRDLITAMGVATDKGQLLSGAATGRIETRDLTDDFDDHETRALVAGARAYLAGAESSEGETLADAIAVEAHPPSGAGSA